MESLFETKLLSHKNDPETSKETAQKMVESGKLPLQEHLVFTAIKKFCSIFPNFTAKELAFVNGKIITYHIIQRRLSGLYRKGYIERTGEKRNGCAVWKLKN